MSEIKLNRLLEAHRSFSSSQGLTKNFGDPYLLEKNRIYAKIRNESFTAGIKYSDEKNDFYSALSLSQLQNTLETKTISYLDNVSVLKSLPSQAEITWDDIQDNLRKNYVFHESCHTVARNLMNSFSLKDLTEEKILQILLEESFANTCEFIAVIDAKDSFHRIFYQWNSYTFLFEERTHLEKAITDMGGTSVFKFLLLSYLQANFLRAEMNDKDLRRILALAFPNAVLEARQIKTLKYLSKIAFTLDQRFREVTTRFHLRLCGFHSPMAKLLDFDFLIFLEKQNSFQKIISLMTAAALPENF